VHHCGAVTVDNRHARQMVVHLRLLVEEQEAVIEAQAEELARLRAEREQRAEPRPVPAIY